MTVGAGFVADIGGASPDDVTPINSGLGPYSEQYGSMTHTPVLTMTDRVSLPAVRLTLLAIHARESETDLLRVTGRAGRRTTGAVWLRLAEVGGLEIEVAARTDRAPHRVGPLETDARLLVVRRDAGETPTVFTAGGQRVQE